MARHAVGYFIIPLSFSHTLTLTLPAMKRIFVNHTSSFNLFFLRFHDFNAFEDLLPTHGNLIVQ